jgi:hypothetical protein
MINIRLEEINFLPEISKIIADNFKLFPQNIINVQLSSDMEDTKESFDMIYSSTVEISVRIRDHYYLKYGDFTVRSKAYCGNPTEIDKLIAGKGSIYLYAWKTLDQKSFETWVLIDINKIRPMFTEIYKDHIINKDGTAFKAYSFKYIKDKYNGIINQFNLENYNFL